MERKPRGGVKFSLFLFVFEFAGILAETCETIDVCSCRKSNGKVISLWEIDGGSKGPAVTGIPTLLPTGTHYQFDWNPCTKFNKGIGCKDMLVCQTSTLSETETHPCADTVANFDIDSNGNTVINYQPTYEGSHKRTFKITLKCDPNKYPGVTDGVTEAWKYHVNNSRYSMTFSSKCACDDACAPQKRKKTSEEGIRLSTGSILLIVFFVLLFVYLVAGIIIKRYKMGVESVPEVIPNYEFWAVIPSLVKDGVLFTYQGVTSGCTSLCQKCSKDGYAEIKREIVE